MLNLFQKNFFLVCVIASLFYGGVSWGRDQAASALLQTDAEYKIVYESDGDLFMMNMLGNNKVNITNSPSITESHPNWSPDGTQIAYLAYTVEDENEAYVMNRDGSNSTNISQGLVNNFLTPVWSPDSSKLLFVSQRTGKKDIFVVNRDGANLLNLTNSSDSEESQPVWSPDGTKIAFSQGTNPYVFRRVKVMDADGGNVQTLTEVSGGNLSPAWSPDGSQIAFSSGRDSDDYDMFLMNADGSNQRNLTALVNNSSYLLGPFKWSPDGANIIFSVEMNPDDNSDVFKIRVSDGRVENLTETQADEYISSQWSADGSQIVCVAYDDSTFDYSYDILVMNADGSGLINLTNGDSDGEKNPSVSPIPIGEVWQLFLPMIVGK